MDYTALKSYGIDAEQGLARCMGDEAFYKMLLAMFSEDDSFERAKAAFLRKDYKTLFACLHELKGACGNAAMTDLYSAVGPLVELLRAGVGTQAQYEKMFAAVQSAYDRARAGAVLASAS